MRYTDFKTFTRQTTLPALTNDTGEVYRSAVCILDKIRLKKSVSILGVSLSSLSKGEDQMPLFQQPNEDKKAALAKAVDAINDKFGEHAVTHGASIAEEKGHRVISPAWRPSGVRKSDVWAGCRVGQVGRGDTRSTLCLHAGRRWPASGPSFGRHGAIFWLLSRSRPHCSGRGPADGSLRHPGVHILRLLPCQESLAEVT
ncbi:MAG: hypothetical protein ABSH25_08015 [Syntrophorhabdales bacterium]